MLIETWFEKILEWHYNSYFEKKIFYQNLFLCFYGSIVWKIIVCDVGLKVKRQSFHIT